MTLSETQGNVFWQSTHYVRHITDTLSRLYSKDCKSRSFSSQKFPHTFIIFVLEDKIQNPGEFLCGWKKSSISIKGVHFQNFEIVDGRIASALNKIIQNSYFKKKGQSGGTESSERGSVPSRKTDRFDGRAQRAAVRQANIRENKGPSLKKIQVKLPHQRRLKDKSDAPAEMRGDLPRISSRSKEKDKATLFSPTHEWSLPAPSTMKPEDREFVVDAGASVHMLSRKDLNSAELETVKVSESPTTVVTANGKVQTEEEATVYVRDLDLFVTVMLLEDTPAVLSIGKLCEDHGYNYHWTSGQKPHLIKNGRKIDCNAANYVPFVAPGLSRSSSSSSSLTSPTSSSQEAAALTHHPASMRSESTSGIERVRGDPSRGPAKVKNPIKKWRQRKSTGKPVAWSARMVRRDHGEACGWQYLTTPRRTREFFSWIIFRAASKSGIG